ncbi:cytochrome P450 [Amycolatopsis suaedae]|uniref:Cytochrome P450 n=1 Tax=Amycolatopsis suaedae TaxID=2510978 RepID=A0A4Q7J8H9_9PSEU|nr:cytochrome P450 [Amycolatopsis suaedae]RZQ63517.1 cytochrome P450 [Amycolatopsis suaedae]
MRTMPFERPDPLRPPPAYAELRAREPVARVRAEDGSAVWLVTSYNAVVAVLGDDRFGVNPPGGGGEGTLLQDGDGHRRLRRLVGGAFTPGRIEQLRPRVRQLAEELAGALPPSADLVADFAAPLAIGVIAELLGVDIAERDRFRSLADAAGSADFTTGDAQAWLAFAAYIDELVAAKRERLGDDLISTLLHSGLGDHELTILVLSILAAGYLTATNAIAVGAVMLLAEGRLAPLATAGDAEVAAVVEEIVRLQIGVIGEVFPRWAREDVELAGVTIRAGERVLCRLGAANRDPGHFADPDAVVPGRADGRHIAFGRGPHHCLGAALARMEVAVALRVLAELPGLSLSGPVAGLEWNQGSLDAGPAAVPVTTTSTASPATSASPAPATPGNAVVDATATAVTRTTT